MSDVQIVLVAVLAGGLGACGLVGLVGALNRWMWRRVDDKIDSTPPFSE